jgi:hypothetical protein
MDVHVIMHDMRVTSQSGSRKYIIQICNDHYKSKIIIGSLFQVTN